MSNYSNNIEDVFLFTKSNELLTTHESCIFVVPPNIQNEKELLAIYYNGLWIGELGYFGNNWDALADVMWDFGWVPKEMKKIIIYHLDLPMKSISEKKHISKFLHTRSKHGKKIPMAVSIPKVHTNLSLFFHLNANPKLMRF